MLRRASFKPTGNITLSQLRWIWPYIRRHWREGATGTLGMLGVALLSLPGPYLLKVIIDQAIVRKNMHFLNTLIISLFGIQVLLFAASWLSNYFSTRFSLEIIARIKEDLFHRILRFPMSFFVHNQTGYLMSRIAEVDGLNFFFSSIIIHIVYSFFQFVVCLGVMAHLNAKLTAIALFFLPLFIWISRSFTASTRFNTWQFYEKSAIASRSIQDSLSGIEIVKAFGAEAREAKKAGVIINDLKNISIRRSLQMSLYSESLTFLNAGAGFIILWWSGWRIISGQFTLGSYLAFSAYFAQLFGPAQFLANIGIALQPAKVALQRISELMDVIAEDESGHGQEISSLKGNIELNNVYFEYEAAKPVIVKANITIGAGEKILIAGPNGSGKSTLIKLIMGFYQPQAGDILFDGRPVSSLSLVSLRERISIVSQNTFLFSETVRNNVLFSAPDATNEELEEALRLSGAMEFIRAMPQGLDTEIGERGIRISGGERQKLSIARAILRSSDLIIFDEATTHLDESSALRLCELIRNRFEDKTCLVISHRPIEIPVIDRTYWIERGHIREIPITSNPLPDA